MPAVKEKKAVVVTDVVKLLGSRSPKHDKVIPNHLWSAGGVERWRVNYYVENGYGWKMIESFFVVVSDGVAAVKQSFSEKQ